MRQMKTRDEFFLDEGSTLMFQFAYQNRIKFNKLVSKQYEEYKKYYNDRLQVEQIEEIAEELGVEKQ